MTADRSVLILGGASDIGRAIACEYVKAGRPVILAAREPSRLESDVKDLRIRSNVGVRTAEFDILDTNGHARFLDELGELPATVVCVVGLLGDQTQSRADAAHADLVMRTNYMGPALFLAEIGNRMEARGNGCIIGIGSVAGDRGRASNYVYGSAKAGFAAFLSGLRNRLFAKGVAVITVKPGFCNTRMTAGMALPKPLTAEPEEVGRAVLRAEATGRDVIYVRPIWRLIMVVIRHIPEIVFKRLSL